MGDEQRHRQPVHAEGDAAGVQHVALGVVQAPDFAEMFLVIVEAHAGGGLFRERTGTSSSNFSASSRCWSPSWRRPGRRRDRWPRPRYRAGRWRRRCPGRADPGFAEFLDLLRRADADIFAHAEALEAVDMARRLMAETVARPRRRHSLRPAPRRARRRWDRPGNRRPAPAPGRRASGLRSSRRRLHAWRRSAAISRSLPSRQETAPSRLGKLFR